MKLFDRTRARWQLRAYATLSPDAREGDRVQVTGTVRALDATLVAPLSGLPCVGYRARARGAQKREGKPVITGWLETMQLVPFAVDRDDGTSIIVDGNHAVFGVTGQTRAKRNPDREVSFLARHALTEGRPSLYEVFLESGRRVSVGGTLVLVAGDAPPLAELGFREPPPPEQRLSGSRDLPLVIVTR